MNRLAGKVALVTGAAGGMGSAITRRFRDEGAKVVGADLRRSDDATASVSLDVTNEESWQKAIQFTIDEFGRLDIVVNNAGVVTKDATELVDTTLDEFQRVQSVNVTGVFLGTKAAIRAMEPNKGGAIVNIGSIASFVATPTSAAYAVSKAAVTNLSKQTALECARRRLHIRVNTIHPGFVWTSLISEKMIRLHGSESAARAALTSTSPLGRLVEPEDVAWAAVFLASDEARLITGADIVVDGGRLLQ